jgi:hypothetical protein
MAVVLCRQDLNTSERACHFIAVNWRVAEQERPLFSLELTTIDKLSTDYAVDNCGDSLLPD